jgi:hypothetical protein
LNNLHGQEVAMAIVRSLEKIELEHDSKHSEVNGTYAVIEDRSGSKYLQIDREF